MNNEVTTMLELPKGWVWATVSATIEKVPLSGRKLKRSEYQEEGILPVIDQGQIFIGGYTDRQELKAPCEPPVIIFGDHTKVIKYVNFDFVAGADGVRAIKPLGAFFPKLFYYFLQTIELPEKGYARHFQFLEKSLIPLPPLPEQHRIVAKIEELFTRLDAGVEALKKIKAQLRRYRQAVLKHAFEGKLTEEWRQAHQHELEPTSALLERIKQERLKTAKGKYKDLPPLDISNLPRLPEGWVWARVGDMSVVMGGKRLPKGHQYADVDTGMPYIRVADFRNMTVDMTNLKFLKQETKALISKYTISRDDLYISIAGSIGKVGTVPDRLDNANLTENAAKITDLRNDKRYMCYVLNSSFCQEQILRLIVSSNQPKLALFRIEQIIFPLSPPSEQNQIVSEIERRFSIADQIEKTVDHSLKQAERLRQSILKRAFEGKLVPQNPNDEPVGKLLERIKAERTKHLTEVKASSKGKKKAHTKNR
jgi:type I restriction enzyme S subunit